MTPNRTRKGLFPVRPTPLRRGQGMKTYAAVAMISTMLFPAVVGAPGLLWLAETVDDGNAGTTVKSAMSLDANGVPHIFYTENAVEARHAFPAGEGWQSDLIGPGHRPYGLARDGVISVVYLGGTLGAEREIYYAKDSGSGFEEELVHTASAFVSIVRLALDADGDPHVVHAAGSTLYYSERGPSGWVTSAVASGASVSLDLEMDSLDRPHIVYRAGNHLVKHVVGPAPWTSETVPECGYGEALDIDAADNLHVSCHSNTLGLVYAMRTPTGWTTEAVPEPVFGRIPEVTAFETDIAVTAEGEPHIVASDLTNFADPNNPLTPVHPKYATRVGEAWLVEHIERDSQGNGHGISIDLSASGQPHVAYVKSYVFYAPSFDACEFVDCTLRDLMYARPALAALPSIG